MERYQIFVNISEIKRLGKDFRIRNSRESKMEIDFIAANRIQFEIK